MSNLVKHAQEEFRAAGWCDESGAFNDAMQQAICTHVLKLLEVFSEEGHSGTSAPYAVGLFKKLAMFEPIAPLTGEEWEWTEPYSDDGTQQNKRCSHVFRRADGTAYDMYGRIFREPNGATFTSIDSRVDVEFPYTPKREYVDVPAETEE